MGTCFLWEEDGKHWIKYLAALRSKRDLGIEECLIGLVIEYINRDKLPIEYVHITPFDDF